MADLLTDGELFQLEAREQLFHSGEYSDCFYIVLQGQVQLFQGMASENKPLITHQAGESSGFASMLALQPRVGDAQAGPSGAIVLKISSELFSSLYEQDAEAFAILLLNLTRNMSRSLRTIAATADVKPEIIDLHD